MRFYRTGYYSVDEMLAALGRKEDIDGHTERLKGLGAAAVPEILPHLRRSGDRRGMTIAFYALQHCWSPEALPAVLPFLTDADATWRDMAAIVIARGAGFETLCDACRPLLHQDDPALVRFALTHIEPEEPDIDRMRRLIGTAHFWPVLVPHLPRYRLPELVEPTLAVLKRGADDLKPHAVAALIHQGGPVVDIMDRLLALLPTATAPVRELIGEYVTWHGDAAVLPMLAAALERESDPYAAASLRGAEAAIRFRHHPNPEKTERAQRVDSGERGAVPNGDGRMEPRWAYRGQKPDPHLNARKEREERVLRHRFGFPIPSANRREEAERPRLLPPVRDYFDPERTTYGKEIDRNAIKGFGGLVHVGDDVAWNRPHATVVAVAAGRVRQLNHDNTWGWLVIIEHPPLAGERFCTVYGHLGSALLVRPGDRVRAGQKIGSVGRAFTWENGGYGAHLHFAVHRGPYTLIPRRQSVHDVRYQGRLYRGRVVWADSETTALEIWHRGGWRLVRKPTAWVVGYVSKENWEWEGHGWQAPQEWLQRWMKRM